jgi:hypothetical protein
MAHGAPMTIFVEVTEYEQTNSYVDNVVTYLIVVAENFDQGNMEGFRYSNGRALHTHYSFITKNAMVHIRFFFIYYHPPQKLSQSNFD